MKNLNEQIYCEWCGIGLEVKEVKESIYGDEVCENCQDGELENEDLDVFLDW